MSKRKADTISVAQLFRMFPDENACYAWLEEARWDGKPVCPHCGGIDGISQPKSKPHTYWHKDCRKQFTVTTKTCMHATKRPLQDWIFANLLGTDGPQGCQRHATLERNWLSVSDGMAYASPHS